MSTVTVQELIEAGVHYGHQASRWNPKMKPFIYGKRHRIHLIDLQETIRGLYRACYFLRHLAEEGKQVLFLGTKRQIRPVVEAQAKRCGMPAVTERWIGGTLTNFKVVRERLQRLEELEKMEEDGVIEKYKKKDQAALRREMRKIRRNLAGIRDLHGLPGAIIVVDPRREENCIREAARMNVPVICILDTDCDPDAVDIPIPANDDAMSSVDLLLGKLADAILEGQKNMDVGRKEAAEREAQNDPRAQLTPGRRETVPQGDRRRRPPVSGGRSGRQPTGRFADRRAGHADSVSIGTEPETADTPPASAASSAETPPKTETSPPAGGASGEDRPAGPAESGAAKTDD